MKRLSGQAKRVEIPTYVLLVLVDVFGYYFLLFVRNFVHINSISSRNLIFSPVSNWRMQNLAAGKQEQNSLGRVRPCGVTSPGGSGQVRLKSRGREEVLLLESPSLRLPSLLERGLRSRMSGKAFSSPAGVGDSLQVPRLSVLLQE